MTEQAIDFSALADKLPPLLSRRRAESVLGGLITAKTLANLDSLGTGCPTRVRMMGGRKVGYPTVAFLAWIQERIEILE